MLDGFQPTPKGGFTRAYGHAVVGHVWAGNVPALPIWSMIAALLVKSASIGKAASAEPISASWFAETLAEVEPRIGACLAVLWWRGGDARREDALLGEADAVIAYGNNETLEQLRARVPITTRFLPHGHKISFAMVAVEALDAQKAPGIARRAALDIVRYDQQGCYAPQAIAVERGAAVSPREFAGYLAGALAGLEHRFPRRALSLDEAKGVAEWSQREQVRSVATLSGEVTEDEQGRWSVAYSEEADALGPSGLNRTIRVIAVDTLDEMIPAIEALRPYLQTVGLAAGPETTFRLADALGHAGVTRIAAIGQMAAPEAGWHHDGRFTLADLVTMVDIDRSAEAAAEGFAPYAD